MNYTPANTPRKGLAVASLVLGILSIPTFGLIFVGGIVGLVLGIVAFNKAKSNPTQYTGRGLAIGGIVTSALSLFIAIPGLIVMAIAIPNLLRSTQIARETAARSEVRTIGRAQLLYSVTKGNGRFTDLRTLGEEGLVDSSLASGQKGGYLFSSEPVFFAGYEPMFETIAKPVNVGTAKRSFGSNETFVIYEAEGIVDLRGTPSNRAPARGTPLE